MNGVADLVGKTFGTWKVKAFAATGVTSQRGGAGGKQIGPARRALWECECTVCGTVRHFNTSYLTAAKPRVHGTCKKVWKAYKATEIKAATEMAFAD